MGIMEKILGVICETKVTDPDLRDKIDSLAEMRVQADALKKELKALEQGMEDLVEEVLPVVEALEDAMAQTDKYVVAVIKKGFDRQSPKYKEAFVIALKKVNAQTRKVLQDILDENTSISKVSAQYKAYLKEGVASKIKSFLHQLQKKVIMWWRDIKALNSSLKELERLSKN